ncbi:MAG: laccase domain-containing protein, partial [Acidobacteriaceae bacterium]
MGRPPKSPFNPTAAPTIPKSARRGPISARNQKISTTRTTAPTPPIPPKSTRNPSPGLVTIPAWSRYPWLRAAFSTRQGGLSTAYATGGPSEQNLGYTPEADPQEIAAARRRLVAAVSKSRSSALPNLITIRQCHTGIIQRVDATTPLTTPEGKALLRGDALYTRDPNLLLGILTADCVPVLVADTRTHAVAAF